MSGADLRLEAVEIDEESLAPSTRDIEHERQVAIFDLLEENRFAPEGAEEGPFSLKISLLDGRLALYEALESSHEPLIFTDAMKEWPAARRWTFDWFASEHGDLELPVEWLQYGADGPGHRAAPTRLDHKPERGL